MSARNGIEIAGVRRSCAGRLASPLKFSRKRKEEEEEEEEEGERQGEQINGWVDMQKEKKKKAECEAGG
jgi:hypothetical protein